MKGGLSRIGLTPATGWQSFGSKYVEFESGAGTVKLALYKPRALAKDAGVASEGSGSHRLVIGSDLDAFTDPDGFAWEKVTEDAHSS